MLDQFLFFTAFFFDFVGLGFVIGAGVVMLKQSLPFYFKKKKNQKKSVHRLYHFHRQTFVHRIVLGLDFFIVADLVKVAFANGYESLIQILFIVIIRTILSYFLMKEADY